MKKKNTTRSGQFQNRVERGKIDTPDIQIHDSLHVGGFMSYLCFLCLFA